MKFLFFVLLAASSNAFSAVDYSYCQKQFNNYIQLNKPCETKWGIFTVCASANGLQEGVSSYFPFELTGEGKVKIHPTMNSKIEDGKEIISSNDKNMGYEAVITRNDQGDIIGVKTIYKMKNAVGTSGYYGVSDQVAKNLNSFERVNETNVKLEVKNGKCVPSRIDSVNSLGDESRQDVLYDLKLCRNLAQFFKKNPEAASCFDKKLMERAQGLFNDFYKDNQDIYGEGKPDSFNFPRALKTKLKSDVNGNYAYPGTGAVGGIPAGFSMGMPGATTDQMLAPMLPSVDSILSAPKVGALYKGFGHSPVVSAVQIMSMCEGGGFGPNVFRDVIYDESVWKAEPQVQSSKDAAVQR